MLGLAGKSHVTSNARNICCRFARCLHCLLSTVWGRIPYARTQRMQHIGSDVVKCQSIERYLHVRYLRDLKQ